MPLRPLSLGEIFDRAVTLYAQNAVLFTLIALVVVVPVAIVSYFAGMHNSAAFAQILDQIQHPNKTAPAANASGALGLTMIMVAAAIILGAFVIVAIATAVSELYRSGRCDFSSAYTYALRRSGAILVVLLCEIVAFFVIVFAGVIAMSVVLVAAFLLVKASTVLGVVAFVISIIAGVVMLFAILLCYIAFVFAFNALGIEDTGAWAAIARGFSRIFNRSELGRASLICLALVAIYLGLSVVSISVAALFEALNLHILEVLVSAVISLITTSFLGILLAVYYFDVRVRREGLDMQAEIAELQPTASA